MPRKLTEIIFPVEGKVAGYLLLLEVLIVITYVFVASNGSGIFASALLRSYFIMHLSSCVMLGLGARKLNYSWLRFGVLPVFCMLPGAAVSYFVLKYGSAFYGKYYS